MRLEQEKDTEEKLGLGQELTQNQILRNGCQGRRQVKKKSNFSHTKNVRIEIFKASHIWLQHEKWIQMSTNKPSIGSVVVEIAL